jgi:hypothetical protein
LLTALNSGEAREVNAEWLERKQQEWLAKHAEQNAS